MAQPQSNTPSLHPTHPSFYLVSLAGSPQSKKLTPQMLHKAGGTTPDNFPEKMEMAGAAPVKIGTRGTVGSLVMKEIEYFSKLELERGGTSRKPQTGVVDIIGSSTPTRKKRRGSWFLLPNMCSAVEVSRSHRLNGLAPGLSYRTLKSGKP